MKYWIKVHKIGKEVMVALCDENLLGKKLNLGKIRIEINKEFYGGKIADENEVKEILKDATIINAFGKNSIELLAKEEFISKKNILIVDGVPHAQYAKI